MPAHCRRAKYEKDCHVVYRQSLIFLHLSHFSQKNKAYLALEIDFVSDLNGKLRLAVSLSKDKAQEESFDRTFSKVRGFLRQSLKSRSAERETPLRFKQAAPLPTVWKE